MANKIEIVGVILGAAKIRDELSSVFGNIPTSLIPINGKPAIFFILDHFKNLGIKKIYISVGYKRKKVEKLIKSYLLYTDKLKIYPIAVNYLKKPGYALLEIINKIPVDKRKNISLYVYLADTLPCENIKLPFDKNFILVSKDYSNSKNWCVIEINPGKNEVKAIYDKQKNMLNNYAVVGVYHFSNMEVFSGVKHPNVEISYFLKRLLNYNISLSALEVDKWYDLGHINKYYEAKSHLLSGRFFNKLEIDSMNNTIVKRSDRNDILKSEIDWYLNVPKDISKYVPRIISKCMNVKKNIYAEFEFYGYPSLSELWLYSELSDHVWRSVLDKIFLIIDKFRVYKKEIDQEDYIMMYDIKTKLRVQEACSSSRKLNYLFSKNKLIVNGKSLDGWPIINDNLKDYAKLLYNQEDNCFLHGDLCFSNILYDLNNGVIKMLDPRGRWGSQINYGDIKYDIAKLRHSISGLYDHIMNDRFNVSVINLEKIGSKTTHINTNFPLINNTNKSVAKYFDHKIGDIWNIDNIKLIEGLLFISMIPLHADNEKRQLAMFARGIELLNDTLKRL